MPWLLVRLFGPLRWALLQLAITLITMKLTPAKNFASIACIGVIACRHSGESLCVGRVSFFQSGCNLRMLLALIAFLFSNTAFADQFYLTTTLNCDTSKSELAISFRGVWNEEGEKATANLQPGEVDPRKLIAFSQDKSGKYSLNVKSENKVCRIGGQDYIVTLSPFMAKNFHPEGYCASRIGAKISIRLQRKVIAVAGVDACTEEGMVIRSVSIVPGHKPSYKYVNARQFYGT
jgi:hypothetical protein